MRTLINKLTARNAKLGYVIAMIDLMIILMSGCSAPDTHPDYPLMIHSSAYGNERVISDQPLKVGDLVLYEDHYYTVIE